MILRLLCGHVGTPCSLKDGSCLTDRKATNNEEFGTTLILSVDDEPINHMVIEECISGTGYKVKLLYSTLLPDSRLCEQRCVCSSASPCASVTA